MIRVQLTTRKIGLVFKHMTIHTPVAGLYRKELKKASKKGSQPVISAIIGSTGMAAQRRTTCEILHIIDDSNKREPKVRSIVQATVKTYFKDQFTRADGRRKALEACFNLLSKAGFTNIDRFNKVEREAIWATYFANCPISTPVNPKRIRRKVKQWIDTYEGEFKLSSDAICDLLEAVKVRI